MEIKNLPPFLHILLFQVFFIRLQPEKKAPSRLAAAGTQFGQIPAAIY